MSEKKKKSLVIAGLTAAGLLAVGGAATITTLHSGSSETEKDPKDQLKDDLTNVKNDIDDLINSLDSEDNKEEIKILENLKDKIDQALQDPNITEGDLNSLKDEANQTLQDLINKKKEFDKNLLGKYDETKNVLDEYKNSLGDDPKYDSLKEKLDKLNEKLENSKNKHSESELLSKEQIKEIKKELEDTIKELDKIKYDKSLIDLEEAKKAKDEFLASFGNPAKPEYEDLLNKYKDKWDEIDKNIEALPNRDDATLEDIKKVENIIKDMEITTALEKLEKAHADQNKKLDDLIKENTIEPLDDELQKSWDKLYEDAKSQASFDDPTNQSVQKIEEAIKNYIDESNQMIEDLTNLKDSEDLDKYKAIQELKNLINSSKDYSNNELNDSDYSDIKNKLEQAIAQAEKIANTNKDLLTIEQIKDEIRSLQEALENAKAEKNKIDSEKINESKDEINNLIKDVNDFINSNLNTKGEEEIKKELEEAIKNNTPDDFDDLNSLKDKLENLNKVFNEAKDKEKEREQLIKDLENELAKAQDFSNNNLDDNKHLEIKNQLQDLIDKTKEQINDFSNQELKDKKQEIIDAVKKAENDKLITDELVELNQKIIEATNVIEINKFNDKGEKDILDKLVSSRDNALNKYNEIKSSQDLSKLNEAKEECKKLAEAIKSFEIEKAQRDRAKKQLEESIGNATEFLNNLNSSDYDQIKKALNNVIESSQTTKTEGDKLAIEEAIDNLSKALQDAWSNKNLIDQEKENKSKIKAELDKLIPDVEKWQKSNLKNEDGSLIKPGYTQIDSKTTEIINNAKTTSENAESNSQSLKEALDTLKTEFENVKTQFDNYTKSFNELENKINELKGLITNDLSEPIYKDIQKKYQVKLDNYNNEKNNKNLDQFKETIEQVTADIESLKKEKIERDQIKESLENSVQKAKEFINTIDKKNSLNTQFVSNLESLVSKANEELKKEAVSEEELKRLQKEIDDELKRLITKKPVVDSLIKLENKIDEINNIINQNNSADPGLNSALEELKTAKNNAENSFNDLKNKIDSTTQEQVDTVIENLNNALTKFNNDKTQRGESKKKLQNKIDEAKTVLGSLTDSKYEKIKNELDKVVADSNSTLTNGDKDALDKALTELENKINQTNTAKNEIDKMYRDIESAKQAIQDTITKMNQWKNGKLVKDGEKEILNSFNNAISEATQTKDKIDATLNELVTANETLNQKFNQIISAENEFSINYQKVNDKITELENYINNNLNQNIYADLKSKYDKVVSDSRNSINSKNTEELKTLLNDLTNSLNEAQNFKAERDKARSELQKSIDNANNLINGQPKNQVYSKLFESLENLKTKGQNELGTSTTNDELSATSKEINEEINKVVEKLNVVNELNKLNTKLEQIKTVLEQNKNVDHGLSSVVNTLQNQYNDSKNNFDNWLNNIDSSVVTNVAVEENKLDTALNTFNSDKQSRENSKGQLSNLIEDVKNYKDNTLSTKTDYSQLATKAQELIDKYTPYLKSQTKSELDQSIADLKAELAQIKNKKILIDQENQTEEEAKNEITSLIAKIREWQSTNLTNGLNGALIKEGYKGINDTLESSIKQAEGVKDDTTSTLKDLKDEFLQLNLAFNNAKNSLTSHQNAYKGLENAISSLKSFVDTENIGTELKNKYSDITKQYNDSKDTRNETELIQDTAKVNQALEQLRNEKRERDTAISELANKITAAKTYIDSLPKNDLSSGISSSLQTLIDESTLVQNSDASKQAFIDQKDKLDKAISEANTKKPTLESLIKLSDKIKEAESTLTKPEYVGVSTGISSKLQSEIESAKRFLEENKNNLDASQITIIDQKTTELDTKIKEFIADVKEFNVAKESLEKVATEAQSYIDTTLSDPIYSNIKSDLQTSINKKDGTIANGNTQEVKDLTVEISNKLAEAKVNKEKLDSENKQKEQVKRDILALVSEMTVWSRNNLTKAGTSEIKTKINGATKAANLVKNNSSSTLEQLRDALTKLQEDFKNSKSDYETYKTTLASLESKISDLQSYINVSLTEPIYGDIKSKYQAIVDKYNKDKTSLTQSKLVEAIATLTNEINNAKQEKNDRDTAKTSLNNKINEVNTFITSLGDSTVYNKLKEPLNNGITSANQLLNKASDNATLNAKTTELDNLLTKANADKTKLDALFNLESKIALADKLLKDNESADSGLASVIKELKDAKDAAKTKFDSWMTNPLNSDSTLVKQEADKLNAAIEKFNADKAAREASKSALASAIADANSYAQSTLNKDQYLELKNELETFLKDQDKYATTETKAELDSRVENIKTKLQDIKKRKDAIDQAENERQNEISKLGILLENVKQWQNTNLREASNNTILKYQGLSQIDSDLSKYITAAETVKNRQNSTTEQLKKAYSVLETAHTKAQTQLTSYNNAHRELKDKISELKKYVTETLKAPEYKTIQDKYQAIVNASEKVQDNLIESQLKEESAKLVTALQNAKAEKENRDKELAKAKLEQLIQTATTYSNDSTDGVGATQYSSVKATLVQAINNAKENINTLSKDQLNSRYTTLEAALNKAKADKVAKAKEIHAAALSEADTWIAQNLSENKPAETQVGNSLKTDFEAAINLYKDTSSNDANDIYQKAQNIKAELEKLKLNKTTRDAAEAKLDALLAKATELKNLMPENNEFNTAKTKLENEIERINNIKSSLNAEQLLEANKSLETVFNESVETYRNNLKKLNANATRLLTEAKDLSDKLNPTYTDLQTKVNESSAKITSLDYKQIAQYYSDTKPLYDSLIPKYNSLLGKSQQLNALLKQLDAEITRMKTVQNGNVIYKYWITEAEDRLAKNKVYNSEEQVQTNINYLTGYIPALKNVVAGIDQAYAKYLPAKENANAFRKALSGYTDLLTKYDQAVTTPAKTLEDKFMAEGKDSKQLTDATAALNKAEATFRSIIQPVGTQIQNKISGDWQQTLTKIAQFAKVTTSPISSHKGIALDKTALDQRDALVKEYNNLNPQNLLNTLTNKITQNIKPTYKEYDDLLKKLNSYIADLNKKMNKIYNDNWTRNGGKHTHNLAKQELDKKLNANLHLNSSTGLYDKQALELEKTVTYTYNGNDQQIYYNYAKEIQKVVDLYTLHTNEMNKRKARLEASTQSYRDSAAYKSMIDWQQKYSNWNEDLLGWAHNTDEEFTKATREFASYGIAKAQDFITNLFGKRNTAEYGVYESFILNEMLKSINTFKGYWDDFGDKNWDKPLKIDSSKYNSLRRYVFTYYRYSPSKPNNTEINIWSENAKRRYVITSNNFNYDYHTREASEHDKRYNHEEGVLNWSRRDWWGGTEWENARVQRMRNTNTIFNTHGMYRLFTAAWSDIKHLWEIYTEKLNQLNKKQITELQFANFKVEYHNLFEKLWKNNYVTISDPIQKYATNLSITYSIMHPTNLSLIYDYISKN